MNQFQVNLANESIPVAKWTTMVKPPATAMAKAFTKDIFVIRVDMQNWPLICYKE